MDSLTLNTITATAINPSVIRFFVFGSKNPRKSRSLSFPRKPKRFLVFASKDDPKLDGWDNMELKFGQLLGEDPKLTLAKIMSRKSNPDTSYVVVEKSFYDKKGKSVDEVEEVPFVGSEKGQSLNSLNGLNLVRPVPKKGVKFEANNKPITSEVKKPSQPVMNAADNTKGSVPNVILRKPTVFCADNETEKSWKLRIRPNLSLKMGKEQPKERFGDITLLKKPEPVRIVEENLDSKEEPSGSARVDAVDNGEENVLRGASLSTGSTNVMKFLEKPTPTNPRTNFNQGQNPSVNLIGSSSTDGAAENSSNSMNSYAEMANMTKISSDESLKSGDVSASNDPGQEKDSKAGLQSLEQSFVVSIEKTSAVGGPLETNLLDADMATILHRKPERLDQFVKQRSKLNSGEMVLLNPGSNGNAVELENFLETSSIKGHEDTDWATAEDLVKTGGREEVELISSSTRGFVVSFGSLIGFLPYRNLAAKWKFLAFESWLRRKGLDPSIFKHNLGIIGSYDVMNNVTSSDSNVDQEIRQKDEEEISRDMKLEDLLRIYDQEKLKFLSSFVGQKIKVNVVLADRISRRLIFSVKPKEKEELVERKKSLMVKLSIGDVVKCCIKKITYFGIFVEVEGVSALIHQTEVSWDATLDPASYFKIGQIVEAKVHQLDFALERIFLSLKEITPDPLIEALEAVVGDHSSLDGRLEAAQADTEWDDMESIIKELQQFEGIQSVSKGRFFLSPGLAPTFQVYMASMFENQYKLLARSGNRVQEVIVETSLSKEDMKSAILTCTSRVE